MLFDNNYELLHDRIDIRAISPITAKDYFVEGSTALLDAIGKTINKIARAQQQTAEEYRAEKVLFVITTAGMENASREYGYAGIKALVAEGLPISEIQRLSAYRPKKDSCAFLPKVRV